MIDYKVSILNSLSLRGFNITAETFCRKSFLSIYSANIFPSSCNTIVPSDWRLQQHGHDMTDGAAIFSVVVPPDLCRDVRVGYPTGKAFTKQLK